MRSARLRHRISVEHKVETRDVYGGVIETWTALLTSLPAEIIALQGRELLAAQSLHAGVTARITVRHRNDITPMMRIKHGTQIYAIKAVIPDATQVKTMAILCEQGMSDG